MKPMREKKKVTPRSIYNKQVRQWEQGLRSGESTRLPPVWLGFKSQC